MPNQDKMYNGMRNIRDIAANMIPPGVCYVEPFGGHAWVAKEVCDAQKGKASTCIIGDINPEPLKWVQQKHKNLKAIFKVQDWKKTVNEAPSNCVFLFDPPFQVAPVVPGRQPGRNWNYNYYPDIKEWCDKTKRKCIVNLPNSRANLYNVVKPLFTNDKRWKCIEGEKIQKGKKPGAKDLHWRYLICKNF